MYNNFSQTWYQSAPSSEKELFKSWLKDLLKTEEVDVTFRKIDGSIRKMKCTLREDKLPVRETSDTVKSPKTSTEALTVFDLEKSQWRSFRFDTVTEIKFVLE